MSEYALFIDNQFQYTREFPERPVDIPHKKVTWHPVVREAGASAFEGLENGNWVIRTRLPTLDDNKKMRLSELADVRWEKETGGTVFNGMPLATDPVSQTKYIGAVVGMQLDPKATTKWKTGNGFVNLDASAITAIALAVRNHIQACFDREAVLAAAINAAKTETELYAIDLNTGWPN